MFSELLLMQLRIIFCCCFVIFFCCKGYCQSISDTAFTSEDRFGTFWKVKPNKGLFGLSKPDFGPFITLKVSRDNNPVKRKKIKSPTDFSADTENGMDIRRNQTTETNTGYNLQLVKATDTIVAAFIIHSVVQENKKTLFGKMLSKNSENGNDDDMAKGNVLLSYSRNITGTISLGTDSMKYSFSINDLKSNVEDFSGVIFSSAYIEVDSDSLFFVKVSETTTEYGLQNTGGKKFATLVLQQEHEGMQVQISADADSAYQYSIAALFAVIIAIKDI